MTVNLWHAIMVYLVFGAEQYIYEPLTAGTLETMHIGVETSYKAVTALKVGTVHTAVCFF